VILVISFALVATLINRAQQDNFVPAASGCASTSGKVPSSLVSAHTSGSTSPVTYYFDSLVNLGTTGTPGLIKYCVYYSGSDPTGVAVDPSAKGADNTLFQTGTPPPSGSFSFGRGAGGNTSNIPLDGATHTMGTATWGSVPGVTFLLHINDDTECNNLYANKPADPDNALGSGTCWVLPSDGQTPTPTPTNTPAGVPTPTDTPPPGSTPTPTIVPTPTIIPTPTGTPHPK
jgi:hypothetical protein